jgi:hypothetical protein
VPLDEGADEDAVSKGVGWRKIDKCGGEVLKMGEKGMRFK